VIIVIKIKMMNKIEMVMMMKIKINDEVVEDATSLLHFRFISTSILFVKSTTVGS